jgi:glycosyltransferase involved in cell wall biosynthesis
MSSFDELVVLSHLRWDWVWQRPQHLVSRLASGQKTWFVEEPLPTLEVSEPVLRTEQCGNLTRVWLDVPVDNDWVGFDDPSAVRYPQMLAHLLREPAERAVWLYTPVALPLARALKPFVMIYDVMDDLASFKRASAGLKLARRSVLEQADVVFTGGRSLHTSTIEHRPDATFCFPSGVEPEHYAQAVQLRADRKSSTTGRKVAGYVGVIDERLDLQLVGNIARALPEWTIRMVGPLAKISKDDLPVEPNIEWAGPANYQDLPRVMAGFDVALMPFALNEATKSISPTKTLEYLAAGLPVVSTKVADVVADYSDVVALEDDAAGFASACVRVVDELSSDARLKSLERLLHWHHWDTIAARMSTHIEDAFEMNRGVVGLDLTEEEKTAAPAS